MYVCPRCNYITNRKNNLSIHFNRKKDCKNINNVRLGDVEKQFALQCKVKNDEIYQNNESSDEISDDLDIPTNSHDTNLFHILHVSISLSVLEKYEELFNHLCKDKSNKITMNEKKEILFGGVIRTLNDIKWNDSLEKIPCEIDVKDVALMMKYLVKVPDIYRSNPTDIVFNTVVLQDYSLENGCIVYGTKSDFEQKLPECLNKNDQNILSHLTPILRAFERNSLKIMYAQWNFRKNVVCITDRLGKLYNIMNALEIETTLSQLISNMQQELISKAFVHEILDISENDDNYDKVLDGVQKSRIISRSEMILRKKNPKEEMGVKEQFAKLMRKESETSIQDINTIFFEQCVSSQDFLSKVESKVNRGKKTSHEKGDNDEYIPEVYDLKKMNKL